MAEAILASLNTATLIFGGCCSNVFTLESIIKTEPDSGLLITFFQFTLTTLFASISQIQLSPFGLRTPTVPFHKWAKIAAMFFAVNMLNNWAFAFNISVPVHIILRSFGSVTTMGAGWLRGKSYSVLQVISVGILTLGVLVSAFADAESKGKKTSSTGTSDLTSGLLILLAAQVLSAYMGVYVQDTYAQHGASWRENLFYSHFLSLPFFLPFTSTLSRQYSRLLSTPPLSTSPTTKLPDFLTTLLPTFLTTNPLGNRILDTIPSGIAYLLLNAVTQLACIAGVNLLSAQSSAVTVTIVLNVRKLVSFMASTWIFGHDISGTMKVGAGMVFGAGALYGWETSWRMPRLREQKKKEGVEKKE